LSSAIRANDKKQDLGSLQELAKQQYNTLAALITNSSNSADQANARLLQTLVERRNIDADWWDEVKLRAQEQIEVDAATARREMSVQLNEMRSFVSALATDPIGANESLAHMAF
jgi:hypothetical protein